MPDAPCGLVDCPIVKPANIDRRHLRTHSLLPGAEYFRAARSRYSNQVFTPAVGNGRFSPLANRSHLYMAEQRSAALLESALHEADGPNPRIYAATLQAYALHRIRFDEGLKLLDLRDPALADLGLTRGQLTDAGPRHYPCSRRAAQYVAGTKGTVGLLWTSRQGTLHAQRNQDGLAAEVLRHESLDVAVVYQPDFGARIDIIETEALLTDQKPTRFVIELANLLQIAIL